MQSQPSISVLQGLQYINTREQLSVDLLVVAIAFGIDF